MSKTIIISNRLPVKITDNNGELTFKESEGGLATGLGSIFKKGNNLWVGWPGMAVKDENTRAHISEKLQKDHMMPVFLSSKEIEDFYEGFCNGTLWPNFHYFNQYTTYSTALWETYEKVNKKFAKVVNEVANEEDTIWVHDYQLLLLPQLLRMQNPNSTIGFFLHIPFPSYELFRLIPWRKKILMGMLGADFLGFHTYDDMRHFLSCASRLASLGNEHGKITLQDRTIRADALPMGIDYEKYEKSASSPNTLEREVRYRTSIGMVDIILSIDRLDYSKGIPQRLKAFEKFLEKHPEFLSKVSILMIVVPSRDNVPRYAKIKEEIEVLVGRINGKYGRINWTPVNYFYRSFPLSALSAFYRMSKVAMVTPMRDGMNLVCKEYIASKLDQKGVLILSEMAGASKELSDAIVINPNDIEQMVAALHKALTLTQEEQIARMKIMQTTLKKYNIHAWVKLFMKQLQNIKDEQNNLKTKKMDNTLVQNVLQTYKKSKKRIFFLDYDGTLVDFETQPESAAPSPQLKTLLKKLANNPSNKVVIITGRDRKIMNQWMEGIPLDIVAEHGMWIRQHNQPFKPLIDFKDDWKEHIKETLEFYVNRTPLSFIEEKDYSLVWHYRNVETGLGEVRTRELTSHLKYLTGNENLQVMEGDKVIEVKSSEVNKGKGALHILEHYDADFVMACGDDRTDEDTFSVLPSSAFSIKVGSGASQANYSVTNYQEILNILKILSKS